MEEEGNGKGEVAEVVQEGEETDGGKGKAEEEVYEGEKVDGRYWDPVVVNPGNRKDGLLD